MINIENQGHVLVIVINLFIMIIFANTNVIFVIIIDIKKCVLLMVVNQYSFFSTAYFYSTG